MTGVFQVGNLSAARQGESRPEGRARVRLTGKQRRTPMSTADIINNVLGVWGYKISKNSPKEYEEFSDIYTICKPYTMTSIERMYALYKSVEYIAKNKIPGDFIECGVWRGGSSMLIALTLSKFSANDRKIYLFDTFEGMSTPSEKDVDFKGQKADLLLKKAQEKTGIWCYADLEDVQNNMAKTNYPSDKLAFIKGKVEDTLSDFQHQEIALLRLDTDWYASTLIELRRLYPMLVSKGVLIIDDYGHWAGARKAVDEYINNHPLPLLLNRIDYSGRLIVKP